MSEPRLAIFLCIHHRRTNIQMQDEDEVFALDLMDEARKIADLARERNITLKVAGATSIKLHCPKYSWLHETLGRTLSDLDLIGFSKQTDAVVKLLNEVGYTQDKRAEFIAKILQRYTFRKSGSEFVCDVFFDKLEMNHTIDFSRRLEVDHPTIPLAELLLTKMQIVRLTEKDMVDSLVLLREHHIGSNDKETINGDLIAKLLANDWGFYYTFSTNMQKIADEAQKRNMKGEDKGDITNKVKALLEMIENEPKSFKWKMRQKVGTRKKWYTDVENI